MRIGRGIMGLIGVTVFLVLGAALAGVLLKASTGPVAQLTSIVSTGGALADNLLAPVGLAAMTFVAFGVFLAILFGAIKGIMGMAGMRGR